MLEVGVRSLYRWSGMAQLSAIHGGQALRADFDKLCGGDGDIRDAENGPNA